MPRFRSLALLCIALAASLVLAACGGDDGGDEDPQEVLNATFTNDQDVNSGVFDVSVDVSAEGGDQEGSFEANLGGPFQSREGAFPLFDVDAEANLDSKDQDFSGNAGIASTGDKAFVSFQETDYEVPQELFDQFATTYTQLQEQSAAQNAESGSNFLSTLGINPANWLTDTSNEGTEDVEGTETIHISGEADVPKLIEDIKTIAENAPAAAGQQLTPANIGELDQLVDIIESADFDVYTGKDDDILRKLEASVSLNPPDTEGSPDSVDFNFTVTLSELNEPQEVAAPASAQPLGDLLNQFGIDPSTLGAAVGSATGGGGGQLPQAGGSPAPPSGGASQAYLECLQQAQGAAALQQCAALLQQ